MKNTLLFTFLAMMVLLAACGQEAGTDGSDTPTDDVTVYTIGFIQPLTGDGAEYGLPLQRVTQLAVEELNAEWAAEGKRLDIIYEDGKCNGKGGLIAAQKLVNVDGVKAILGAGCSSETLGAAPFTEENKVILLSPLSSSPDVTNAGDYVFRNYPSDTAQAIAMADFITEQGYARVGIVSENTDYAQALRAAYKDLLPAAGVEIIGDEVVAPKSRDVRTQVTKILNEDPDAVLFLPQSIPMAGVFAKQAVELGMDAIGLGNDVLLLDQSILDYGSELEGFYGPHPYFEKADSEEFASVKERGDCELGLYCAAAYDSLFIMADMLELCGDQDADCIRDALYATQGWQGLAGETSFDENGDPAGSFQVLQVRDGKAVMVE